MDMSDATRVRFRVRARDVARSTGPMRTASKILSFTRECGDACAEVDRHLGRDTHLLWAAAAAAAACPSRSTWPLAYSISRPGFRARVMRARTSAATYRLSPVYAPPTRRDSENVTHLYVTRGSRAGREAGWAENFEKFNSGFRVRRSDGKVWDLSSSIFYFVVLSRSFQF